MLWGYCLNVIPAKAGIQAVLCLDSRLRGSDDLCCGVSGRSAS